MNTIKINEEEITDINFIPIPFMDSLDEESKERFMERFQDYDDQYGYGSGWLWVKGGVVCEPKITQTLANMINIVIEMYKTD